MIRICRFDNREIVDQRRREGRLQVLLQRSVFVEVRVEAVTQIKWKHAGRHPAGAGERPEEDEGEEGETGDGLFSFW